MSSFSVYVVMVNLILDVAAVKFCLHIVQRHCWHMILAIGADFTKVILMFFRTVGCRPM